MLRLVLLPGGHVKHGWARARRPRDEPLAGKKGNVKWRKESDKKVKTKRIVLSSVLMLVVAVLSMSLVMPVRAASTIIVPSPAYSIQDAINLASPGDTVLVLAGTYDQAVIVDESITLKGDDAILRPVATPLQGESVIYITHDDVTVENFEIDGTGKAVYYGIYGFNVKDVTIEHVVVHDMTNNVGDVAGVGILLFGWGQGIDNCIIDRTTVYNTPRMGIFIGGMQSAGEYKWLLSNNNVISRSNVYNTWIGPTGDGGGAVQINGALNCVIEGNNIHHNALGWFYVGLYIYGSAEGNIIKGNNLHHNTIGYVAWINGPWVVFDGHAPTAPTLVMNKIHDNQYYDPTGWVF
jgi:parallel beta-helix repeat protein